MSSSPLKRSREEDATEELLLQYMSTGKYEAKTVTVPEGEGKKAAELKATFLERFKAFEFDSLESRERFDSFECVRDAWENALPAKLREECEGPITAQLLAKHTTSVKQVCENFLKKMGLKSNRATQETLQMLKATLFLLEGSLAVREQMHEILKATYDKLIEKDASNLNRYNGPRVLYDESVGSDFMRDVEEGTAERRAVKTFFDLVMSGKKVNHVLRITGEGGSGKTHMGLYAAKLGLPPQPRKTLTVLAKAKKRMPTLAELEKGVEMLQTKVKELEGKIIAEREAGNAYDKLEEELLKAKKERGMLVADFLCNHMCELCGFDAQTCKELTAPLVDWNGEKLFETTVLVADQAVNSPAIMQVLADSAEYEDGFMDCMQGRNMSKFFGTIYVVCSSNQSGKFLLVTRPWNTAIRMKPSKDLFEKLVNNKSLSDSARRNDFICMIVENRSCAVYAAEALLKQQ